MTNAGYEKLLSNIAILNHELKEVNKEVTEGMADRDFREDSTFAVAVQERIKIENKIAELGEIANNSTIIDVAINDDDSIDFGKSARLLNVDTGVIKVFTLVGSYESNPKDGKISYLSPMGKSMMGSKVGDEIEVVTPARELYWEVLKVFIDKPL